jgi:hypothetical protein
MNELPPLMRDQRKTDADHLRLLAIFQFIFAGLGLLALGFLFLHYSLLHHFLGNPELWKHPRGGGPPPEEFFAVFKWIYVFLGLLIITGGLLNIISGLCIGRRRLRTFSLVVGGLNCLQIPFGTVLGVFMLVVLLRDSVREAYAAAAQPPA